MKRRVWTCPERKDLKNKRFFATAYYKDRSRKDYRFDLVEDKVFEPRIISFESWHAAKRAGWVWSWD